MTSPCYVSVDVETSGPIPETFSLLQIGACVVDDPDLTFSCFVCPVTDNFVPAALEITGLDFEGLKRRGLDPAVAMKRFRDWVCGLQDGGGAPVFVGLNAAFDWSFVNFYFHRYLGENPFGHSALDIKSLYMGVTGVDWHETGSNAIASYLKIQYAADHDALNDAKFQASLFSALMRTFWK